MLFVAKRKKKFKWSDTIRMAEFIQQVHDIINLAVDVVNHLAAQVGKVHNEICRMSDTREFMPRRYAWFDSNALWTSSNLACSDSSMKTLTRTWRWMESVTGGSVQTYAEIYMVMQPRSDDTGSYEQWESWYTTPYTLTTEPQSTPIPRLSCWTLWSKPELNGWPKGSHMCPLPHGSCDTGVIENLHDHVTPTLTPLSFAHLNPLGYFVWK